MVNSTIDLTASLFEIYNSRNLYGQFDRLRLNATKIIYNSRNLYGQFDVFSSSDTLLIYNSRNLYGQFD